MKKRLLTAVFITFAGLTSLTANGELYRLDHGIDFSFEKTLGSSVSKNEKNGVTSSIMISLHRPSILRKEEVPYIPSCTIAVSAIEFGDEQYATMQFNQMLKYTEKYAQENIDMLRYVDRRNMALDDVPVYKLMYAFPYWSFEPVSIAGAHYVYEKSGKSKYGIFSSSDYIISPGHMRTVKLIVNTFMEANPDDTDKQTVIEASKQCRSTALKILRTATFYDRKLFTDDFVGYSTHHQTQ